MFVVVFALILHTLLSENVQECFQYQRNMTISNINTISKTFSEVYIMLNTWDMFNQGLINENCTDFGIYRNGTGFLPYWMEGECRTNATGIFISLSYMTGEESIDLQILTKCNDSNIINTYTNRTTWNDGFFYILTTTSCYESSSSFEDANDIQSGSFIKMMDTFNDNVAGGHETHTHGLQPSFFDCSTGGVCGTIQCETAGGNTNVKVEGHTIVGSVSPNCKISADSTPPWLGLKMCRGRKLRVMKGFVLFFNESSFPEGMVIFSEMNGRYPRIYDAYSGIIGGAEEHNHVLDSFSTTPFVAATTISCVAGTGNVISTDDHTHKVTGISSNDSNIPDSIDLPPAIAVTENVTLGGPGQFQAFQLASAVPPMGWAEFGTGLYGRFLRGGNFSSHHLRSYASGSGNHGNGWTLDDPHYASDAFDVEVEGGVSLDINLADHTHTMPSVSTIGSSSANNLKRTELKVLARKKLDPDLVVSVTNGWVERFPKLEPFCSNGTICNGTCKIGAKDCNTTQPPCTGTDCGQNEEDDDDNNNQGEEDDEGNDDSWLETNMVGLIVAGGSTGVVGAGTLLGCCMFFGVCSSCICCVCLLLLLTGSCCGLFRMARAKKKVLPTNTTTNGKSKEDCKLDKLIDNEQQRCFSEVGKEGGFEIWEFDHPQDGPKKCYLRIFFYLDDLGSTRRVTKLFNEVKDAKNMTELEGCEDVFAVSKREVMCDTVRGRRERIRYEFISEFPIANLGDFLKNPEEFRKKHGFFNIRKDIRLLMEAVYNCLQSQEKPIVSGRIHPTNILIFKAEGDDDDDYVLRLRLSVFNTGNIPAEFKAPELRGKSRRTPQGDVYSLGMTLQKLIATIDGNKKRDGDGDDLCWLREVEKQIKHMIDPDVKNRFEMDTVWEVVKHVL